MTANTSLFLEKLFEDWQLRHAVEVGHFISDGIIGTDEEWWTSPLRVLFLTKESNDPLDQQAGNDHDLRQLFRNPHLHQWNNKRFEYNVGRWAYGLHCCRGGVSGPIPFAEADKPINRLGALRSSAVVNLKKLSGNSDRVRKAGA
jgi:hypothetical protein